MKDSKKLPATPTEKKTEGAGRPKDPQPTDVPMAPIEEITMISCFAVFPDGAATPAAVFTDLEDAMDWGLERYGGDAFGIRYLEMAQVETAERRGAPGPA